MDWWHLKTILRPERSKDQFWTSLGEDNSRLYVRKEGGNEGKRVQKVKIY